MSITAPVPGFSNVHPASIQIRDLIYGVAGIFHTDNRLSFVEDRQFYQVLTRPSPRGDEMDLLLNEITIGETCFYRNRPQLAALQRLVLPSLAAAKEKSLYRHLRIWSAGCSTGEEPYTLAMILLEEASRLLRGLTFEIVATDLNDRSLRRAQEGIYGEYALRNVSPDILRKYFHRIAGTHQFRVRDEVRKHVKFSRVNLLEDARMLSVRSLDVIFCCNVLIYFDDASKKRVLQHFYSKLLPHSYLFLGHTESLFGMHAGFQLVRFPGAMAHTKTPVQR